MIRQGFAGLAPAPSPRMAGKPVLEFSEWECNAQDNNGCGRWGPPFRYRGNPTSRSGVAAVLRPGEFYRVTPALHFKPILYPAGAASRRCTHTAKCFGR